MKKVRKFLKDFQGNKEMSFLDHLEEMRWTIFKCLITLVVAGVVVGVAFTQFNDVLRYPLTTAEEYLGATIELRSTSPLSPFMMMFYIVLGGAFFLSLPFIFIFIAQFIAPGLTKHERRMLLPGGIAATALFIAGSAFAFFFILPLALRFSDIISSDVLKIPSLWDAQVYYSFIVWVTLGVGASFELPLLLAILIILGIVTADTLRKNRAYVIVGSLVFGMLLTPGDGLSMCLVGGVLYAMFEGAIVIGAALRKRKEKADAIREAKEAQQEAKERLEYAQSIAEERKAELEQERTERENDAKRKAEDPHHIPDDYDPNDISNEEYRDDHDYGYEYYDDFEEEDHPEYPDRNFAPDWSLNKPDTDFFAPHFDDEKDK